MKLAGSVAVITGGARGIGLAIGQWFLARGHRIALIDIDQQTLERTVAAFDNPRDVLGVHADVSDPGQVHDAFATIEARFGRIDALVNSAYVPGQFGPVESADLDDWRGILEVNLFGTLQLTRAVIPVMKKQGGGAIVMISSMVTRKPMPHQGGYMMSKAALTGATAQLALELGRYGIRVNTAYMGWMWGPPVEGYLRAAAAQQGTTVEALAKGVAQSIPLGRIPDDADCAKAALFLASDYACAVTGAALDVNGGEFLPR